MSQHTQTNAILPQPRDSDAAPHVRKLKQDGKMLLEVDRTAEKSSAEGVSGDAVTEPPQKNESESFSHLIMTVSGLSC